jgi:dipeptidyl aminopeptidase/acylaminoacyl peptidase
MTALGRALAIAGAVASAALAAGAAAQPAPIPVRSLFSNPAVSSPALSPDGRLLAFVLSRGDLQLVATRPTFGGPITPHGQFADPKVRFGWLGWAKSDVLWVSNDVDDPYAIGVKQRASQLFAITLADNGARFLGWMPDVVHWLPDDAENVLIDDWGRVRRMRASDGRISKKAVQPRRHKIVDWSADAQARLRVGIGVVGREYQLWARAGADGDLTQVARFDIESERGPAFAGFHADPGKLYVESEHEGRSALFTLDIANRSLALAFAHPRVDVLAPLVDERTQRVIGAFYADDRPRFAFFDPEAEREHARVRAAIATELGREVEIVRVSEDRAGALAIYQAASDVQPPAWFLHDARSQRLLRLFDEHPGIDAGAIAATQAVRYRARDGLEIPAYLTLPPGREPRDLPLVVIPHGGPHARDMIDWNPELQLFASRGFAVLQMNFRGSSGYGRAFAEAGHREWGGKMQDDITDGVRWAIERGVADPERIGIYGTSYGGYAALMGLVRTPELFAAGAAYAGVTDLPSMLAEDRWFGPWTTRIQRERVGGGWSDRERLRTFSSLRRAGEITAPVLLGHGEEDGTVRVDHSREMHAALRKAGKRVRYLEFPHEIHGFALEANRIRWYEALSAFFEENLAPRPTAAPAAEAPAAAD